MKEMGTRHMREMGKASFIVYLDTIWNGQLYTPVDLPPFSLGNRTRGKFLMY
jgi:hypothetical protein